MADTPDPQRKFSTGQVGIAAASSAIGSGAAVMSLAGPIWVAIAVGAVAGLTATILTNDIPKN
ncbi:MAG: hypothetical protein AAF218_08530 [Pseudomonadota bacterium]